MGVEWKAEIERLRRLADRIESGETSANSAARSLRQSATRIESVINVALDHELDLRRSRYRGPRKRLSLIHI